ncbi:hypothetical protein Tco_0489664 [Tanacetum coccineum]
MSTSYITISLDSDDESTSSSIPYIILSSNSKTEDTASPATLLTPPSPNYVLALPYYVTASDTAIESLDVSASPDYAPGLDIKTEPFEENPHEAEHDLEECSEKDPSKEDPFKEDLTKTVWVPYTLPLAIESAIADEIAAPPRKRTRSPSPPPPLIPSSPSSSSPSPLPSPLPPPRDTLPPCKRFQMTSPHPDTTDDAMVEATAPHKMSTGRAHAPCLEYQGGSTS